MESKRYKDSDYIIYKDGRCYSEKSHRFLIPKMTVRYPTYHLSLKDGRKTVKVHRMVAETFLPILNDKNYVNHIDGDTHNFSLENLEWVSASENTRHAVNNQLMKNNNQSKSEYFKNDKKYEEEWVEIINYPDYLISNYGRIIRKVNNRLKKTPLDNNGYPHVNLWQNNQGKTFQVHKLVYSSFFPDEDLNGYVINHIDGNKTNNNLLNLEKVSYSQNNLHAEYISKKHSCAKKVGQFKDNLLIRSYGSIAEASRITGISNISRAIKNNSYAGNYKWKFL